MNETIRERSTNTPRPARRPPPAAPGGVHTLWLLLLGSVVIVAGLVFFLYRGQSRSVGDQATQLKLYCGNGPMEPVTEAAKAYEAEYGVRIEIANGGSGELLSSIKVHNTGDLYLPGDITFLDTAKNNDPPLIQEVFPLATMRPVIVVKKGNPKSIHTIQDLLRDDVRVALGDPANPAIGKVTKKLLTASGQWDSLQKHTQANGSFQGTVTLVANALVIGSADAGVIWDADARQYPSLEVIPTPELDADAGVAHLAVGVLTASKSPTEALRFARFLAARDKGLTYFQKYGYQTVEGDPWAVNPKLTLFAGSVNQEALAPIIAEFEQREGVKINTVYNGCGLLTAQMNNGNMPDVFIACDRYYLDKVQDKFEPGVDVSDTDIVIVVKKGNPKQIQKLEDLRKENIRVTIGREPQSTIGVLTQQMLTARGWDYEAWRDPNQNPHRNVVAEKDSSAQLVPDVVLHGSDATIAYRSSTTGLEAEIDTIAIDSDAAKAVQPYSIAKASPYPQLMARLFDHLSDSRDHYQQAGFNWRLGGKPGPGESRILNPFSDPWAQVRR